MVLEDVNASAPDVSTEAFQDGSSPTSDFDPYASSSSPSGSSAYSNFKPGTTPPGYTIDLSKLPRPVPIINSLFGFSASHRLEGIAHAYASMSAVVQRPLTKPECDSIAYHIAKGAAIHSYGEPIGLVAGYYRYNATRAEFRFPFWKPDLEKLNRDKLILLRGNSARIGWDLLRLGAYGGLGGALGKMIVGSYAATVVAVGQRSDMRMKDIVEKIRVLGNEEAGRRVRGRSPSRGADKQQSGESRTIEDYGGVQPDGDIGDDNSPTAPFIPDRSSQSRYSSAYLREQSSSSSSSSTFDDFDNASPTARPSSSSSESAWDRLRTGGGQPSPSSQSRSTSPSSPTSPYPSTIPDRGRQAGDAWASLRGGNNTAAERRAGSTIGDSFTVAGSDEERAKERERAQREFDEGMERERKGEGFNSRSGRS